MENDELILLGKITRSHGFDGTLVILLEKEVSEKTRELESVFVVVDGLPVPFFILSSSLSGDLLFVRFDGYELKEKVTEFIGCMVMAEAGKVSPATATLPIYLNGYRVITGQGLIVGRVKKVASYPMQVMLVVEGEMGNELLIPLNEEWITGIDKKKKILEMDLPEGMTTLND